MNGDAFKSCKPDEDAVVVVNVVNDGGVAVAVGQSGETEFLSATNRKIEYFKITII